jgi:hypothetical protein
LNTDALEAYESSNGPSFHNEIESQIIHKVSAVSAKFIANIFSCL